jgi:hypothetical protein
MARLEAREVEGIFAKAKPDQYDELEMVPGYV